eukprot:TRINITY_DN47180_c0_g1_i1.p2 TRINITY_DN47180_c0_g1~~TRINITY_DN47180_c0_g1_i1.p2  ORF type:complete len:114 (-),score=29.58 TRINITY_DN47180_c0_g1_i1:110-451(-)
MIRRPPRSTLSSSSAASDVYKRQSVGTATLHLILHDLRDGAYLLPLPPPAVAYPLLELLVQVGFGVLLYHLILVFIQQFGTCIPVSYTHLRAHETPEHLVCRLLLEKKKTDTA